MEKYKTFDKDLKLKPLPRDDLFRQSERGESEEFLRGNHRRWMIDTLSKLSATLDEYEAEIEQFANPSKLAKSKAEFRRREQSLTNWKTLHLRLVGYLEQVLRMMDNHSTELNALDRLKDNVEFFMAHCEDESFVLDETRLFEIDLSFVRDIANKGPVPYFPKVTTPAVTSFPSLQISPLRESFSSEKFTWSPPRDFGDSQQEVTTKQNDLATSQKGIYLDDTISALESSFANKPGSGQEKRPLRHWQPVNPWFPPVLGFPLTPIDSFDENSFFDKLDLETLFYVFYYQMGSFPQLLAASQLKKRGWMFQKRIGLWFLRVPHSVIFSDRFERGAYNYFDYEHGNVCHNTLVDCARQAGKSACARTSYSILPSWRMTCP